VSPPLRWSLQRAAAAPRTLQPRQRTHAASARVCTARAAAAAARPARTARPSVPDSRRRRALLAAAAARGCRRWARRLVTAAALLGQPQFRLVPAAAATRVQVQGALSAPAAAAVAASRPHRRPPRTLTRAPASSQVGTRHPRLLRGHCPSSSASRQARRRPCAATAGRPSLGCGCWRRLGTPLRTAAMAGARRGGSTRRMVARARLPAASSTPPMRVATVAAHHVGATTWRHAWQPHAPARGRPPARRQQQQQQRRRPPPARTRCWPPRRSRRWRLRRPHRRPTLSAGEATWAVVAAPALPCTLRLLAGRPRHRCSSGS